MRNLLLAILAGCLISTATGAQSVTFTTVDNPGDPTFNELLGINDNGAIVGYFGSGQPGHPNIGYVVRPPYTTFISAMQPGSVQTQPTGINNSGFTTGFWSDTNSGVDAEVGFLHAALNGHFYNIGAVPQATASNPRVSQLLAINNHSVAVGFFNDANGVSHGYSYDLLADAYKGIGVGGSSSVTVTGINDSGNVCGFYTDSLTLHVIGFVKTAAGLTRFAVPNVTTTQLHGINNSGLAVGNYLDANNIPHGLYYNSANHSFTELNAPNAVLGTVLSGINNKGQIVGYYTDAATNTHGLLINP